MKIDASIGMPDWEACETCEHHGKEGCEIKEEIKLTLYMGDWILCDDYEKREKWPD